MIYTKNKAFINEMEFYCFKDYNKPKIHKLKTFYHGDMNKVVVREDKNNELFQEIKKSELIENYHLFTTEETKKCESVKIKFDDDVTYGLLIGTNNYTYKYFRAYIISCMKIPFINNDLVENRIEVIFL